MVVAGLSSSFLKFPFKCVKPIYIKRCDFYEVKQHLNITLVWCKLKLSRKAGKNKEDNIKQIASKRWKKRIRNGNYTALCLLRKLKRQERKEEKLHFLKFFGRRAHSLLRDLRRIFKWANSNASVILGFTLSVVISELLAVIPSSRVNAIMFVHGHHTTGIN